jgi:hypothetical protein
MESESTALAKTIVEETPLSGVRILYQG